MFQELDLCPSSGKKVSLLTVEPEAENMLI